MAGPQNHRAPKAKFQVPESWSIGRVRTDANPGAKSVLVVDDDRYFRRSVTRLIRATYSGVNVISAVHGVEALEQLDKIRIRFIHDPLVILTDLHMPKMDGWELIEELGQDYKRRGRTSGIPIIVFSDTSGRCSRLLSRRSIEATQVDYMPLVSVAKDGCSHRRVYDSTGEKGLMQWLDHYILKRKTPPR